MKKILAMILAFTMISALAACGGGESEESAGSTEGGSSVERTTISMTYWNPQETMQPLIDLIEEKLPVSIQYNYLGAASYFTTIRMKLLANNAEDILSFSPGEELNYGRQGLLADVSSICGDDFTDSSPYYVPMNTWYEGIAYNKDIFAEHNITVPTTFDEFVEVCKKLRDEGVVPFTIGAKGTDSLTKCFLGYIQAEYQLQDAGKDFDEKYAVGESSMAQEWTPFLEKWKILIDENIINRDHLGITASQALDEFVTGYAAMTPTGTWAYETIKQKNFNLNFGLMPYLGEKAENACLVGGAGGGYCINTASPNYDLAWKVLEVIASPEGQEAMLAASPGSGSLRKGISYEIPEEFADIKQVLDNGRIYCAWHHWGDANVLPDFGGMVQELILGRTTVGDGLTRVDTLAEQYRNDAK